MLVGGGDVDREVVSEAGAVTVGEEVVKVSEHDCMIMVVKVRVRQPSQYTKAKCLDKVRCESCLRDIR